MTDSLPLLPSTIVVVFIFSFNYFTTLILSLVYHT